MSDKIRELAKIGFSKELAIVLLVITVLAMVMVPLPHELMDVIIAFNIGITVIVLMVVIYMKTPLKLTSFPSILLILALLRIGITISTSRLILLEGDAGQIVSTFGEFVVGGNLIVGIIIFSIITIINFVVITKGSDRVAEVAARFSLDAMPGKQMSIDSDLRANNITKEDAGVMRNELALESKLYGAMDGAMKFVKGDAIASIIDIIVNLVGGLIVGILQHSMTFGVALKTYTILTVGDGLVQQIPAVLISLTSGIMITHVNDDQNKRSLGDSIITQVFDNSQALIAASSILIIMSFIPGMPKIVFIAMFLAVLIVVFFVKRAKKIAQKDANKPEMIIEESDTDNKNGVNTSFSSWKLYPLQLQVASNLKNKEYVNNIKSALVRVQQDILQDLGVEIPNIILRYNDDLESDSYQILVYEIPASMAKLYPGSILFFDNEQNYLKAMNVDRQIINQTELGLANKGVWITESYKKQCDENKLDYMTNEAYIIKHVKYVIQKHVAEFLGIQEVKNLLDKMSDYQDLIRELLRMLPLNKIAEVLQRLVGEDVSIRNFKVILDSMLEWAQIEKDIVVITEQVRKALGRYIAYKFSKGTYLIPAIMLDQQYEDMIRDSIRFSGSGSYLALDPEVANILVENLNTMYQQSAHLTITPVVLTHLDIRRYVRSIIEKRLPYINVLSYQELDGYAEFNGLGVLEYNSFLSLDS